MQKNPRTAALLAALTVLLLGGMGSGCNKPEEPETVAPPTSPGAPAPGTPGSQMQLDTGKTAVPGKIKG